MGTIIAILGTGKGTWLEVHKILELGAFESIVLFVDEWAVKEYKNDFKATVIPLPTEATSEQLIELMKQSIKKDVRAAEFDMALNIASGTGKQHAALISALLQLGYGVRLVTYEAGQLKVLT